METSIFTASAELSLDDHSMAEKIAWQFMRRATDLVGVEFVRLNFGEDGASTLEERLLHILTRQSTRLHEHQVVLLGETTRLQKRHFPSKHNNTS